MTDFDLTTVDRLLTTTRAVRKRLDLVRPVPDDLLTECLRLAVQAPSAADSQSWRWVVVTSPETRRDLAAIHARSAEPVRAQLAAAEGAARKRLESALYLVDHLHEVPVLVVPCIVDEEADGQKLPRLVHYGSIFPAIWSLQLALRSRALGSTILYVPEPDAVAKLLGIPAGVEPAAIVPVAYYTGETFKPARRRPVEEITYWDSWGSTRPA